jgi:hypothetical protein
MRLTLPTLLTGVALGASFDPIATIPAPIPIIEGMPLHCEVYTHEARVWQLRSLGWMHQWTGGPADWELCVEMMMLDHDADKRLRLGVTNNADFWADPSACRMMPKVADLKGYEWPGPDYRRGPR